MKMQKFASYEEYEKWTEQFGDCADYEMIPVAIDDGFKVSMDLFTECKSYKTALRRFEKIFSCIEDIDVPCWIENMRESAEYGLYKGEYSDNSFSVDGAYSWCIEETMEGMWYICLNISGVYANREHAEDTTENPEESRKFMDTESGEIITLDDLHAEFIALQSENPDEYNHSFPEYIRNCTAKNGTLKEI